MTEAQDPAPADKPDYPPYPDDPVEMMAEMLREQAVTLNHMYVDLFELGGENISADPGRGERITGLALRAQANCRAALVGMVRAHEAARQARLRERDDIPALGTGTGAA